MALLRVAPGALCLTAIWLGACAVDVCRSTTRPALEITIENCGLDGRVLYDVLVEYPDGTTRSVTCNCTCYVGDLPGDYHVSFVPHGLGRYVLEERTVTVGQDSCGTVTQAVVYEGTPIADLPRAACQAADDHLASCGFSPHESRCIDSGLRARAVDSGAAFAHASDCVDECTSTPSCDALSRDLCAPAAEITELELCWADCLDVSEDDVDTYAPELGPSSYCSLGGAGGAGG